MPTPTEIGNAVMSAIYAFREAYGYGHVDPVLIFAQAYHETGDFSSPLCQDYRNCFGMKMPRTRPNTATGETPSGYASYDSYADGVIDYFLRQANFHIPDTSNATEYVDATLDSGYAEDPDYRRKWLAIYGEMKAGPTPVPDGGEVVAEASFPWPLAILAALAMAGTLTKDGR